jgi:hypothetical protein
MPNLPENWIELVTPGLSSIFWNGVGETEERHERANIFNVIPSERAFEEHIGIGQLSNEGWNVSKTGSVQFDRIPKLWKPRFEHKTYAKGLEIEMDLFEDNLFSDSGLPATITEQPEMLGRNAEIQRESAAAEVFNYAKTAGVTPSGFDTAGPDGSLLVASDHERYPGAGSGDDQSNSFALTLTATNIGTIHAAARKWKDNAGNPLRVRLDSLLVPVEQADSAEIVMRSERVPGTANNDANVFGARVSGGAVVWDYLTDADLWFYMDSVLKQRLLLWYERVGLEFASDAPLTQMVGRWRARMRYSRGFVHWAFVAGSDGS